MSQFSQFFAVCIQMFIHTYMHILLSSLKVLEYLIYYIHRIVLQVLTTYLCICASYFYHCFYKIPEKSDLMRKTFVLHHSSRSQSTKTCHEGWSEQWRVPWPPHRTQKKVSGIAQLSCYSVHGKALPTFSMSFTHQYPNPYTSSHTSPEVCLPCAS